jgi:hypothetical protein
VVGGSAIKESEYYAGELSDDKLDALSEAGEFYLEESGFYATPTQEEMRKLAKMGESMKAATRADFCPV